MADLIDMTREIGRQLQQDERFIKFRLAQSACDTDEELQIFIENFNRFRAEINDEVSKEARDDKKLQSLNKEMRAAYAKIMTNQNMLVYNDAKQELDVLIQRITTIIRACAEGDDPETADYIPSSCSGSCASCGGCG